MKRYLVAFLALVITYNYSFPEGGLSHRLTVPSVSAKDVYEDDVHVELLGTPDTEVQQWVPSNKHIRAENWLAALMFGECRGQSEACMRAVGHVAMNRARLNLDRRYGKGLLGVMKKPKAFSCFNKNDPNRKIIMKALAGKIDEDSPDYDKWALAKQISHMLMHRDDEDPTAGATHYYAPYVTPAWINDRGMNKVARIDGHIFYRKDA